MTESEELACLRGRRESWVSLLSICLNQLGYTDAGGNLVDVARLATEREAAIAVLRSLCEDHGDNDWDEDLHLADIIDKHLGNHLG